MNAHPISHPPVCEQEHHGLMAVLGITGSLLGLWGLAAVLGVAISGWGAPDPEREERERVASLKPGEALDADFVAHGKAMFMASCSTCHGADGRGMPGKGKNLVQGEFAWRTPDAELAAFIKQGRPVTDPRNTTKVDMPPKGGNGDMTDVQVDQIVGFLRAQQKPHRVSRTELAQAEARVKKAAEQAGAEQAAARALKLAERAAAKEAQRAAAVAAGTPAADLSAQGAEEEYDVETIAMGSQLFASSCATCHGKDARGLPKNGKDLVNSAFCKSQKDEDLIAFIKRGRAPGEPGNTTGIAMPPKGGNPAMNDDKIEAVVAFVRSLQKAETASSH